MPYRRPPEVTERLGQIREQVAAEALEIVATRGWAGASVTAIAARAGISAGALYRHFPSKSDLLVEVFRRAAGRELAVLTDVAGTGVPGESRLGALRRAVAVFARRALDGPVLAFALMAEPAAPEVEAERLVYRRRFRDVFAGLVTAGVARGELPPQEPDLTAAALVGAVSEILIGPLSYARDHGVDADLVGWTCTIALRTAGAPAEPHPATEETA